MPKAGGAPIGRSLLMFIGLLVVTLACAPTALAGPANDDFANAEALPAEPPVSTPGSTVEATKETDEPDHAGDPGGQSVWFTWTPTSSGPVEISTCGSFFSNLDAVLAVYTGSNPGSLTPVASNDDGPEPGFPGCSYLDSEVRFDASAGTTYRIAVDSSGGTAGSFNLRIPGRPANDDFANPQPLAGSLPAFAFQGTTKLATKETGETNHAGDPGGRSVWYSWTPTSGGPVAVSTCTHEPVGAPDTLLAVYTGSSVDSLAPVASNDDAAGFHCVATDSEAAFTAVAGTTYRIAVDAKGGGQGRFDLELAAAPGNDDFAKAQSLSPSLPISTSGSTRLGTEETGEPDHAGDPGGHSVWFSWTPASSGPVEISTCPYTESGPDTVLGVYTGAAVDSLTQVAANDDSETGCKPGASAARFTAAAGTTYRIAVDGKLGFQGLFSIDLRGRAGNDSFATPEVLGPTPTTTGGSTVFATKEVGEPNHAGDPGGRSLWFSWTPSGSGPVDITACGHNRSIDPLLAVYTGSSVDSLAPVASNDDAAGEIPNVLCGSTSGSSEIELAAIAGTTYRIAVDAKAGAEGRFGLAFEWPPANDDFAEAEALGAFLPAYSTEITKFATKEAGEPNHAGDPGGRSLWYSWTPSSSGPVAISTCSYFGEIDTLLAVYTGIELDGLAEVGSNDDTAAGCRASDSEVQLTATAGTTYRIAVDGKGGGSGGVQLRLEGPATNDQLGKPGALGGGLPAWTLGSNRFATKQVGEPDHAGSSGGASVWFKWTAPRSGPVSVSTCGSSFDTLLAVYTGASFGSFTQVQSNDDGSGKCGPQSKLSFDAVANVVYKIAVDGKAGAQGTIDLKVDARPDNDDFSGAEKIPSSLGWYWPGSTTLATKQAGEPDHAGDPGGHSVWFSWTPIESGVVEIEACTATFDPLLALYTGSAVDGLTPVATTNASLGECDEGRSIRFAAVAGTTYRLAVDGTGGDDGHFQLHLQAAAAEPRVLSVSRAGGGTGSVSSIPAGIACGSICTHDFKVGAVVTLTATPTDGSVFSGWSGGGCAGAGVCHLTLNADTVVTANFDLPSSGSGGGGAGNGSTLVPPPTPLPTTPKPLKCKPGFKKVRAKGKAKCIKKKQKQGRGKGKSRR
jgi:Divergent InlB B-repeat domain